MEVVWNDVSSNTIPEFHCGKVTRSLLGEYRGTMVPIPGRDGAWFFPEEPGRRNLTMECWIMVDDYPIGRRDVFREVADWLSINQEAKLELGDMPGKYYMAVLLDPPEPDEWREVGTFDLEWSIQPYAYSTTPTQETFLVDMGDTWNFDFDVLGATYPVVEITNLSGSSIEGFSFGINGAYINYPGTMADDAIITINSIGMAVLGGANDDVMLTGVYEPTDMLMTGVNGSFPLLMPGSNELALEGDVPGADFQVIVNYRKRYRD